jgi:hypothetical protein
MAFGYPLIRPAGLFHRRFFGDGDKCINFAFHCVYAIQNRPGQFDR